MPHDSTRRTFLLATASLSLFAGCTSWSDRRAARIAPPSAAAPSQLQEIAALETELKGRLGVFALDTGTGQQLRYRADEPFPLCSTFKTLVVGAVLKRSMQTPALLEQHIRYTPSDLLEYAPVAKKHLQTGMTVMQLCAATAVESDNTAANLLMKIVGGPAAVTAFARSIGDTTFRLDRWEPELNTAIPGDLRDTSTPANMGRNLQQLVLGDVLAPLQRDHLQTWMLASKTGLQCIKAGLPADWRSGDKSGAGDYGTRNDTAIVWPPQRKPIIVTVYTTQPQKNAARRDDVIAAAARVVVSWANQQAL